MNSENLDLHHHQNRVISLLANLHQFAKIHKNPQITVLLVQLTNKQANGQTQLHSSHTFFVSGKSKTRWSMPEHEKQIYWYDIISHHYITLWCPASIAQGCHSIQQTLGLYKNY